MNICELIKHILYFTIGLCVALRSRDFLTGSFNIIVTRMGLTASFLSLFFHYIYDQSLKFEIFDSSLYNLSLNSNFFVLPVGCLRTLM